MLARPELDQTRLDLLAAADHLQEVGHFKHLRESYKAGSKGSKCVLGAIGYVVDGDPWFDVYNEANDRANNAVRLLGQSLPEAYPGQMPYCRTTHWNNAPERTAQEVIDKLREVAYLPE